MISRVLRLFPIISVVAAGLFSQPIRADEAGIKRFEIEYAAAAKVLAERFDHCQGQFRLEWDESCERMGMDVDFCRSNGFEKVEIRTSGIVVGKKFSS